MFDWFLNFSYQYEATYYQKSHKFKINQATAAWWLKSKNFNETNKLNIER